MTRATWSVLTSQQMPSIVWIVDHDGPVSITNDAEAVCFAVHRMYPNHLIIYSDTMGQWDELVYRHTDGKFLRFASARDLDPSRRGYITQETIAARNDKVPRAPAPDC